MRSKSTLTNLKSTNPISKSVTLKELEALSGEYARQIGKLDSEKLKSLIKDDNYQKLLIYARKAIEKAEPENMTQDYIKIVANEMRILVKMILQERSNSKK